MREPRPATITGSSKGADLLRRFFAAVVLVILAGLAITFGLRAIRDDAPKPLGGQNVNGAIAYVVGAGRDAELWLVAPDGSGARRVATGREPSWSPDGRKIAFWTGDPDQSGENRINLIGANGRNRRSLLTLPYAQPGGAGAPAWSPDGSRIAFAAIDGIYVMKADGSRARRVTQYVGTRACYDLQPSWSPDGTILVFAVLCEGGGEGIWTVRPDGSRRTQLTGISAASVGPSDYYPDWSPDGTKISFARSRLIPAGTDWDIYTMNPDGRKLTKLLGGRGVDIGAAWSPDGAEIAFTRWGPDESQLYLMTANGTGVTRLTDGPQVDCCPSWRGVDASEGIGPARLVPRVTAKIPVGQQPDEIAAGEGSVWVSVFDPLRSPPHALLRIDPKTNEIVARIAMESSVGGLTVEGGTVWAGRIETRKTGGRRRMVVRLDPETYREVAAISDVGGPLAAGEGAVWASQGPRNRALVRIDPATNQVVATISLPRTIWDITVGEGFVWVLSLHARGIDIVKVDPTTNQIAGEISVPGTGVVFAPIVGEGSVWAPVSGRGGSIVVRIAPQTQEVIGKPFPVRGMPFAIHEGGLWLFGRVPGGAGAAFRISTRTLLLDAFVKLEAGPAAMFVRPSATIDRTTGTIWIANYEDTVSRIDLA